MCISSTYLCRDSNGCCDLWVCACRCRPWPSRRCLWPTTLPSFRMRCWRTAWGWFPSEWTPDSSSTKQVPQPQHAGARLEALPLPLSSSSPSVFHSFIPVSLLCLRRAADGETANEHNTIVFRLHVKCTRNGEKMVNERGELSLTPHTEWVRSMEARSTSISADKDRCDKGNETE